MTGLIHNLNFSAIFGFGFWVLDVYIQEPLLGACFIIFERCSGVSLRYQESVQTPSTNFKYENMQILIGNFTLLSIYLNFINLIVIKFYPVSQNWVLKVVKSDDSINNNCVLHVIWPSASRIDVMIHVYLETLLNQFLIIYNMSISQSFGTCIGLCNAYGGYMYVMHTVDFDTCICNAYGGFELVFQGDCYRMIYNGQQDFFLLFVPYCALFWLLHTFSSFRILHFHNRPFLVKVMYTMFYKIGKIRISANASFSKKW